MARYPSDHVPSYRKHKQSGQAVVTLSGRDHLLGPYGSAKSHRQYDQLIAEWMVAGRHLPRRTRMAAGRHLAPRPDEESSLTVNELCRAFKEHAQTYYLNRDRTPGREPENFRQVLRRLREIYGDALACEFGPLKLVAFRKTLLQPRRITDPKTGQTLTRPGWCRNVANRMILRVKHVFKWGTEQELVPPGVYQALQAVGGLREGRSEARESEPVKPVPEPFIDATRPYLSDTLQAMVDLQLFTGMRPGEVCRMRTVDIDTAADPKGKLWLYIPHRHKTQHHGHKRTVYLGPKAQEVLRPFLKPDLQAYCFSPAEAERQRHAKQREARKTEPTPSQVERARVSALRKRKRAPQDHYVIDAYRRAIARAADRADQAALELAAKESRRVKLGVRLIPRWHPHQLRHNAATNLRRQYGLEAAQVILGHRTLSVTEIYAEKNVSAAMKIMAEVG